MLIVSDELKNAFMKDERTIFVRIKIGNRTFDNDNVVSVEYDSGSLSGEVFAIGSTYSNSIKITFSELVEGLKELDEVTYEIGIKLADGKIEYVPMGVFIINDAIEMDRNNNKTTIECMDRMVMMGGAYVSSLSYPAAIRKVALEIANKAGVSVDVTSFERLSADVIAKPEGYTYREVIGLIAQFEAGFATFNRYGKLEIRTLSDPNFAIPPDNYFSKGLVKNEVFFRLGGISCTTDESGDEVIQSGNTAGNQVVLENRVMTKTLLDKIYQKIQTINYYPFSLSWQGNPVLEAGDWVEVEDLQGNKFKTPNLSYSLSFNGGLSAKSSAETVTQSDATYQYKSPLQQKIEWIHARIDAAGGNVVYEGIDEPANPKEGDLWFKVIGPDKEILIYKKRADGSLFWEPQISTADIDKVAKEVGAIIKQADEDREATEQKFDQAVTDAKAYTELKANEFNDQMEIVRADVVDTVIKANNAVAKADQAIADAGFIGTNLTQVKADAANALSTAQNSLATSATAIENAANALRAYENLDISTQNLVLNSGEPKKSNIYLVAEYKMSEEWIVGQEYTVTIKGQVNGGNFFRVWYDDGYSAFSQSIYDEKRDLWVITGVVTKLARPTKDTLRIYNVQSTTATSAEVEWVQVVKGNKVLNGWSPAPEDVQVQITDINGELNRKVAQTTFDALNGTVNTVSTIAYQNKTDIGAKADREVVNTISQTVEKHTLDIKANADGLKFKAEANLVDAIKGTVDNHTAELGIQAQAINARLTSTQVDSLVSAKGYVNQAQLAATSTQWNLALTQVSNDLSSLEIGGRNLLSNSDFSKGLDNWVLNGAAGSVNNWGQLVVRGTVASDRFYYNIISLKAGQVYTVSFDANADANVNLQVGQSGNTKGTAIQSGSWKRYSVTFTAQNTNTLSFYLNSTNVNYLFKNIKLEIGNRATDYNLAQEDMATLEQFTTIDATVKGLQTTVGNKADKTQLTQLANQWTQTTALANGHTSQISSLGTQIDLRVQKGDVIGQITVEAGRTIIKNGQLVLDANTYIMGTTFANDVKAKSLDAVYADIATLKTKLFTADSVTANMVKADAGLFDKVFINDTVVNKLTAKAAFISAVKATEVSADKINGGLFNGANMNMVNINVSSLVGNITNFVTSNWNQNGSDVRISADGVVTTASDNSQTVLKDGRLLVKGSSGGTYGSFGNAQGVAGEFSIDISNGNSFSIRYNRDPGGYNLLRLLSFDSTTIYARLPLSMENNNINNVNILSSNNVNISNELVVGRSLSVTNAGYIRPDTSGGASLGRPALMGNNGVSLGLGTASSFTRIMWMDNTRVYMNRGLSMEGNAITNQSDRRIKKNIVNTTEDSLGAISRWTFMNYEWNELNKPIGIHLGLIAQETPELVVYDAERDIYSIDSSKQMMMTTHAVQQLNQKFISIQDVVSTSNAFSSQALGNSIQALSEVGQLKNKVIELEGKIKQLESAA